MIPLIIATLAIFGIWESVLSVVPWTIPPWLQPLLVGTAAVLWCWPDWRTGLAVLGAVGLLHVYMRSIGGVVSTPQQVAVRRPTSRMPDLP